MRIINGLSEIAGGYDFFIVDLWGVLFNGYEINPAALDCLYSIKRAGKKSCVAGNGPRRSRPIAEVMAGCGLSLDSYGSLITAGQAVHDALRDRPDEYMQRLGRRCFLLCGRGYSKDVVDGLDLEIVSSPRDAEFALCLGPNDGQKDLDEWEEILRSCREATLPMLCANPDIVCSYDGELILTTGALAKRYEEIGGKVRHFGKPLPEFFLSIIKNAGADAKRTLMVGDGIPTDIKGANLSGIDSLFITSGIHKADIENTFGKLAQFVEEQAHKPTYALPALRW